MSALPLCLTPPDTSTVPVGLLFLIKKGFEISVAVSPFLSVAVTFNAYAPPVRFEMLTFCEIMPFETASANSALPSTSLPSGVTIFAVADAMSERSEP